MTLLEEIQTAAIDSKSDLGTILRKCKLLAARLGSQPLEDWLIWESNGYPDNVAVPEYRVWPIDLKGYFSGPFGSGLSNAPIPLATVPEKIRGKYERYECRQSIAAIEILLNEDEAGILKLSTNNLAVVLGRNVYDGYNCLEAWGDFGTNNLVELLNTVRNHILDFTLAVWKEQPMAGETSQPKSNATDPARITQIFNTTIYGGSANLVGSANHSTIEFNIEAGDFNSLKSVLRDNGITEDDLKQLKVALESEERPASNKGFGPKVSVWITNILMKSIQTSREVTIGTLGNLIAQAISKYYGM